MLVVVLIMVMLMGMGMLVPITAIPRVRMPMAMVVSMTVMVVSKCSNSNQVNDQTHSAHHEKLTKSVDVMAFYQTLESLEHDLNANQSVKPDTTN